jgi:hypothetical protein
MGGEVSKSNIVSVVSIKVKKEIKEKMLKYKEKVNWAEEIRNLLK